MNAQHEQQCDLDRLAAYVDGELSEEQRRAAEGHLRVCAFCRTQMELQGQLKHALGRLEARADPPEAVRAKVTTLALRHRNRKPMRRWAWATAAAAVAVAAAVPLLWSSRPSELAEVLVADHLKSVPPERPPEVASSEPELVRDFFAGRLPFEPVAPALPGSKLVGGRLCVIHGHTMELLFYEHRDQTLSLFVSEGPEHATDGCEASLGHGVCRRRNGDVTLMLVGELPESELDRLLRDATL